MLKNLIILIIITISVLGDDEIIDSEHVYDTVNDVKYRKYHQYGRFAVAWVPLLLSLIHI